MRRRKERDLKAFGEVRDRALALVAKVLSECREPRLRVARGGLSKEMEREGGFFFAQARTEARASSWRSQPSA